MIEICIDSVESAVHAEKGGERKVSEYFSLSPPTTQLPSPRVYCFARYYHGPDISMITENHSFTSYVSFNSMIKVLFACQPLYRSISSS